MGSPCIGTVAMPQATEYRKLKAEVVSLSRQLSDLQVLGSAKAKAATTRESDPDHVLHCSLWYVGTTNVLAILLSFAHLHAQSRETIGPTARGD